MCMKFTRSYLPETHISNDIFRRNYRHKIDKVTKVPRNRHIICTFHLAKKKQWLSLLPKKKRQDYFSLKYFRIDCNGILTIT